MFDNLDTATTLAIVVGVVLPALVALVTKELASSKFKNTVLLALSAASAVLIPLLGSDTFDVQAVVTSFVTIFGTSVLTYLGVYKPQGATAAIQAAIPGGLGTVDELPEEGDGDFDLELEAEELEEIVDESAVEGAN
jgi:hypothetical protein